MPVREVDDTKDPAVDFITDLAVDFTPGLVGACMRDPAVDFIQGQEVACMPDLAVEFIRVLPTTP